MSKQCEITKKKGRVANNVSHSKRRTKRVQEANLQWKTFVNPETKKRVRIRVSAKALKTISKNGLVSVLARAKRV